MAKDMYEAVKLIDRVVDEHEIVNVLPFLHNFIPLDRTVYVVLIDLRYFPESNWNIVIHESRLWFEQVWMHEYDVQDAYIVVAFSGTMANAKRLNLIKSILMTMEDV